MLFKIVASRGSRVVFDDRVEADSPREAREKLKQALRVESLTGIVYALTEIPVELIREIVSGMITSVRGNPTVNWPELVNRGVAREMDTVNRRLAALETRVLGAATATPAERFDAFHSAPTQSSGATPTPPATRRRGRPARVQSAAAPAEPVVIAIENERVTPRRRGRAARPAETPEQTAARRAHTTAPVGEMAPIVKQRLVAYYARSRDARQTAERFNCTVQMVRNVLRQADRANARAAAAVDRRARIVATDRQNRPRTARSRGVAA